MIHRQRTKQILTTPQKKMGTGIIKDIQQQHAMSASTKAGITLPTSVKFMSSEIDGYMLTNIMAHLVVACVG